MGDHGTLQLLVQPAKDQFQPAFDEWKPQPHTCGQEQTDCQPIPLPVPPHEPNLPGHLLQRHGQQRWACQTPGFGVCFLKIAVSLGATCQGLFGILQQRFDCVRSQTSLSAESLAAVRTLRALCVVDPQLAVICCGADNKFGHPHASTLDKLEGAGCTVLRTDQDGTVEVVTDGERMWVHAEP